MNKSLVLNKNNYDKELKMNRQKIDYANIYGGIDTLEVCSNNESPLTSEQVPYISKTIRKDTKTGKVYYKLNPDKANDNLQIYHYGTYNKVCDNMIYQMELINPVKTRIDFRFDSFDNDTYQGLLKLNKVIILLLSQEYKMGNRYVSYDPLSLEDLTIRVQSDTLEAENYNKALQEPDGDVNSRLELRSKRLYNSTTDEQGKESTELNKWLDRLDKAVTKDNFYRLQDMINVSLLDKYNTEKDTKGFKISAFIYKYQDSIFSSRQMTNFFASVGSANPQQQAKNYKTRNKIEYFSFNDLQFYVEKIKQAGTAFLETD